MSVFEDRFAIEELHRRFAHAADRADYALVRSFYTDDAVEEHGAYNGGVEGYIEWLREIGPGFEMMHHIFSGLLVDFDGDTAESESRGTAYLRLKDAKPYNVLVITRHFDRYRRVNGDWRFTYRAICVDWVQKFAPPDTPFDILRDFPTGVMGSDDPVYDKVPNLVKAIRAGLTSV